ncbi:MAG: leucine-rich repeat domain-containing protein [Muribaculaceae bacterium]|nr:leucine-rich repeat domain-containing protein [Muribaculaceae bacterium]
MKLELTTGSKASVKNFAKIKAEGTTESIVGKSYLVIYEDSEKYNEPVTITAAANDSVVLTGFLGAMYDVKAAYDASTGTLTIPTGYVAGTHSTYGDVTFYALTNPATGNISDAPLVGKVSDGAITFNYSAVGVVVYNGGLAPLVWMENINSVEANGTMMVGKDPFPIVVSKTGENTIKIAGISNLLYGAYYNVPLTFDVNSNKGSVSNENPIDANITSSSTTLYYLFCNTANGLTTAEFDITTTDDATVLKPTNQLAYMYPKSTDPLTGKVSYSGYTVSNVVFNVDFNIYTAAVEEDTSIDDTNPTIDNINYTLDRASKTAEVTGCLTGITVINIPNAITVNGVQYAVTSVKATAFQANKNITTMSLPASLKAVGNDGFRNVTNLRTLYIEDLTAWCAIEFANGNANPIYNVYPSLERNWGKVYFNNVLFEGELTIPAGVKSIGRSFYGMKSLTKVNLPDGLESIGDQAFANTTKLTDIEIPATVTNVGSAFFGCSGLASVKLNEGLETMGNNMFYGCSALTAISIPASVKTIGSSTFMSCSNIAEVKSLSTVPPVCASDMTFNYCSEAKLLVPAGSIEDYKAATGWKVFTNVEALQTSAIEGVESDENVPVEYFSIQGVKVAADNLTPGIYVKRQGANVGKVYVK